MIDSGSTVDIVANPKFLVNICESKIRMKLHTNVGTAMVTKEGEMPGFGTVKFHPDGNVNILGMTSLVQEKGYQVKYDSDTDGCIRVVDKKTKRETVFKPTENGLFLFKPNAKFFQYIEDEKAKTPTKELSHALTLKEQIEEELKAVLRQNIIKNCEVTEEDVDLGRKIYGPSAAMIKGKWTRSRPTKKLESDIIEIPRELIEDNNKIDLCLDLFFVNKKPFMSSIDRDIRFRKVVPLKSRSVNDMLEAMDEVFRVYNHAGFRITHVDVDREFAPLLRGVKDDIEEDNCLAMDFVSVDDHVPHAERNNRFLKERFRTHFFRMPFKRIPHIMTRHLLHRGGTRPSLI
eukprot:scaffold8007_cov48-Cylindrotheca_fusiformis.AAC.2